MKACFHIAECSLSYAKLADLPIKPKEAPCEKRVLATTHKLNLSKSTILKWRFYKL